MFSSPLFLLLVVAAVVLFVIWRRTEDNRYLYGLAGVGVLVLLYFGYERVRKKTPAELMQAKIEAMAKAVETKDIDGIFEHFSEDFRFGAGLTKASMRKFAETFIGRGDLTGIKVWNFEPGAVRWPSGQDKGKGVIQFLAKPRGEQAPGERYFRCEAEFVLDGDGEWRLSTFKLFDPIGNRPIDIPYLPAH